MSNGVGMETEFHYAQSTRFYLEDRAAGRAWVTKLPFPVQVVARLTIIAPVSTVRWAEDA